MQLKPGSRLKSQVCDAQVVVVKAPKDEVDLRCGGSPMIEATVTPDASLEIEADRSGGSLLGKRYADEDLGIELLCSKGGAGSLTIGDAALEVKGAKALPSSD
jgi:hypothetical protein